MKEYKPVVLFVVGVLAFIYLFNWVVGMLPADETEEFWMPDRTAEATSSPAAAPAPPARPPAPPPPAPPSRNPEIRAAAVAKFTGLPAIRHVEWLDDDFLVAALDNGKSWQPVAESMCGWLRGQGMQGDFAVVFLEAGALRNRNWTQLARARCN